MAIDGQTWRGFVAGKNRGIAPRLARMGLRLLGWPYGGAMLLRRWAYRTRRLRSERAAIPVISVGNLSVGGTGKTPMVAWVVKRLQQAGVVPAIVMRGYKAIAGKSDEAELLRRETGATVIVNPDRVDGAAQARAQGAEVCVLDDGFQHLRLRRDVDIVLLDASDPFDGGCLPGGLLREPPRALRAAHVVVLTRCDQATPEQLEAAKKAAARHAPSAAVYLSRHRPTHLEGPGGERLPPEALAGRRALAFCGIARPESFYATLRSLGVDLAETVPLEDHVEYTDEVWKRIRRRAEERGCEALVTTAKDRVKLPDGPVEVYTLHVELSLDDANAARLTRYVLAAIGRNS